MNFKDNSSHPRVTSQIEKPNLAYKEEENSQSDSSVQFSDFDNMSNICSGNKYQILSISPFMGMTF